MSYFTSTIHLSSKALTDTALVSEMGSVWKALKLKDETDNVLDFKQNKIVYSDGSSAFKADCLVNARDVKTNGSSLVWLTTSQTYSNLYEPSTSLNDISDYISEFGFVYSYLLVLLPNRGDISQLFISRSGSDVVLRSLSTDSNIFKFSLIESTGKYTVSFEDFFLTTNKETYDCKFQAYDDTDSTIVQQYDLELDGNNIFIYYDDNGVTRFIGADESDNVKAMGINSNVALSRYYQVSLTQNLTSNRNINYNLQLFTENNIAFDFDVQADKSTAWVKYFAEIDDKSQLKSVDIDTANTIKNVPVNHLITSPFESQVDLDNESINVNHMVLKNVMTPEYKYTLKPWTDSSGQLLTNLDESLQPVQRTYQKIFCGDNVEFGYDKPLLTFTSNTKLFELPPGDTYFHYPETAQQLNINDSGLIESGARSGDSPITSDRIFKKNANYKDFIYWGDSEQPLACRDGVWLCSWLSGSLGSSLSSASDAVWVDRWYDPSKLSTNDAFEIGYTKLSVQENDPVFIDVRSDLTLDPGVYYKYTRVGTDEFTEVVDAYNVNLTSLRLHYNQWDDPIQDQSNYDNDGTPISDVEILEIGPAYNNIEQYSISLNDESYISIPYSESIELSGNMTIASYVYSNNWKNNPGNVMIANGFRGGASIEYTNHFFNPTVSIIEDTYSHVLQYALCNALADTRLSTE